MSVVGEVNNDLSIWRSIGIDPKDIRVAGIEVMTAAAVPPLDYPRAANHDARPPFMLPLSSLFLFNPSCFLY
jgi:hypothetical protein